MAFVFQSSIDELADAAGAGSAGIPSRDLLGESESLDQFQRQGDRAGWIQSSTPARDAHCIAAAKRFPVGRQRRASLPGANGTGQAASPSTSAHSGYFAEVAARRPLSTAAGEIKLDHVLVVGDVGSDRSSIRVGAVNQVQGGGARRAELCDGALQGIVADRGRVLTQSNFDQYAQNLLIDQALDRSEFLRSPTIRPTRSGRARACRRSCPRSATPSSRRPASCIRTLPIDSDVLSLTLPRRRRRPSRP